MPNLQNNDLLQYTVRYRCAEQVMMNTAYYLYTDSLAGNDDYIVTANAWLTAKEVAGGFIEDLKDLLNTQTTIIDHRVQLISPTRLVPVISTLNALGESVGTSMPTNVAATFTRRTNFATRKGIGSWHQPAQTVTDLLNPGRFTDTYLNALYSLLNEHIQGTFSPGASFGTLKNVLWSRATPLSFLEIRSYDIQATPRVMRRRTVGVGQ